MALTIPGTIPSASRGEKRLFKVLRDELPDDFFQSPIDNLSIQEINFSAKIRTLGSERILL